MMTKKHARDRGNKEPSVYDFTERGAEALARLKATSESVEKNDAAGQQIPDPLYELLKMRTNPPTPQINPRATASTQLIITPDEPFDAPAPIIAPMPDDIFSKEDPYRSLEDRMFNLVADIQYDRLPQYKPNENGYTFEYTGGFVKSHIRRTIEDAREIERKFRSQLDITATLTARVTDALDKMLYHQIYDLFDTPFTRETFKWMVLREVDAGNGTQGKRRKTSAKTHKERSTKDTTNESQESEPERPLKYGEFQFFGPGCNIDQKEVMDAIHTCRILSKNADDMYFRQLMTRMIDGFYGDIYIVTGSIEAPSTSPALFSSNYPFCRYNLADTSEEAVQVNKEIISGLSSASRIVYEHLRRTLLQKEN